MIADPDRLYLLTRTLLYVEDDRTTREVMIQLLSRRVARLIVACDGEEGLAACRDEMPDLIITDIQMPGLDGLAMARQIRSLSHKVPILVTTAFEQSDYFLRSIDIGVDKYIVKPVDLAHLDAALLDCAHRLRAEELLAQRGQLQAELRRHQAIGLLAGGMAHDYNNLLAAILCNVSFARSLVPPGTELDEVLADAEASSLEAAELGKKLVMLASGGMRGIAAVPLVALIRHAFHEVTHGTAVTWEVVLDDGAPSEMAVPGDPRQLASMFEQLAGNAVESMPSGGTLKAFLSCHTVCPGDQLPLSAGHYIHIETSDTGRGIEPELRDQIFDAYFTTKDQPGLHGLGLGLTLCRSIAQKHKGLITVDSNNAPGAAFHLYLPVETGA